MFRLDLDGKKVDLEKHYCTHIVLHFGEHRVVYFGSVPAVYEGPAGDAEISTSWIHKDLTDLQRDHTSSMKKTDKLSKADMFERINQALVMYVQSMARQKVTE